MELVEVGSKKDIDAFIKFPLSIYRNDLLYAPPLLREMKSQFSKKNPFFDHAEVKLFLIKGKGRIASIINRRHIEFHNENVGFFGFFECINDPEVSKTLFGRVSQELKKHALEVMRGPMNFSTNEECGFLLNGFDLPPMLMTPYNPSYYNDLATSFGMQKSKDLFAYIYDVQDELPEKVLKVAGFAEKQGISIRPISMKNFGSDMTAFKEIYNSSWHDNWGFIPLTDRELNFMAGRLKPVIVPELSLIAERKGEPIGFMGLLPDYNHVLRAMKGRLNPVTIIKAIYYSRRIKDLRLLLLGIKKDMRAKGVDALLFREGFNTLKKKGFKRIEFSWVLEDNLPVQRIVRMLGGKLYKTYRIYEKGL
ncbi:MAG: N-acetyltransferase [Nitrospirae bacterium]|nr:N-acetyltransferase [Nitrospirota bacterium]